MLDMKPTLHWTFVSLGNNKWLLLIILIIIRGVYVKNVSQGKHINFLLPQIVLLLSRYHKLIFQRQQKQLKAV